MGAMKRDDGQPLETAMDALWDAAGHAYLSLHAEQDGEAVRYGGLAPDEQALGVLGELAGKRVLDAGCGGGHNAIACDRAGATVTAVDPSTVLLASARRRAREAGASIEFVQASLESLTPEQLGAFDLILATHVLPYVETLGPALANLGRLLAPHGRLVASMDHPLWTAFYDDELDELSATPLRRYAEAGWMHWRFAADRPMRARHMPLGDWLDAFFAHGWELARLLEPETPREVAAALWPEDSLLGPLANVPQTVIFVLAQKGS